MNERNTELQNTKWLAVLAPILGTIGAITDGILNAGVLDPWAWAAVIVAGIGGASYGIGKYSESRGIKKAGEAAGPFGRATGDPSGPSLP